MFLIVVQVSFQQNSYNVNEGNSISIGVVLNPAGSQEYTVSIASRDGSARGMHMIAYNSTKMISLC